MVTKAKKVKKTKQKPTSDKEHKLRDDDVTIKKKRNPKAF